MGKKERKQLAAFVLLSPLVGILHAANVTEVGRYVTVENKAMASQINPLLTVQLIHFPEEVHTVGEALSYWIHYSGYALVSEAQMSAPLKEVLSQPLPQVQRNLGPLMVKDGLEVLVGQPVFSLIQDPLHRRVNFRLKPQFVHLSNKGQGAKA